MPKFLLNENTKVIVSISTLIIVIGFFITGTYTFTTWKTQIEDVVENQHTNLMELAQDFDDRKSDIDQKIKLLEIATVDNQADLVEIKTDIKWIRAYMESK